MKNADVWENYKEYTRDVTENSRKLAFAGVAICWILRRDDGSFPVLAIGALLFIVAYFILDIVQSMVSAIRLKRWIQQEEKTIWEESNQESIEGEYLLPRDLDRPAQIIFYCKIGALLFGFSFIGISLFA